MSSFLLEAKGPTIVLDPEEEASARLAGTLAGNPGDTFAHTSGGGEFDLTPKNPLGFQPPAERRIEAILLELQAFLRSSRSTGEAQKSTDRPQEA